MLLRNISYVYCVNLVKGLLGVATIPMGIFFLGTEGFALFSLYLLISSYCDFFGLGVIRNLSRLISKSDDQSQIISHLSTAVAFFSCLTVILLLLSPLLIQVVIKIFPMPDLQISYLKRIAFFSLLDYLLSIPTNILQANCISNLLFSKFSKFSLCSGISRYGLMFLSFIIFRRPDLAVLLTIFYRVIDIVLALKILPALPQDSWYPNWNFYDIKKLLSESFVLSIVQASQLIMLSLGSIFANRYFGLAGLGLYQAAYNIANRLWFFSNGISLALFPRLVKLSQIENQNVRLKIATILSVSWIMYCLIATLAIVTAPYICKLFSFHVADNLKLLYLLFLGIAINCHIDIVYSYFQAANKYLTALWIVLVAVGCMVGLFFSLKTYFQILAIAIAFIISQLIYALLSEVVLKIFNVKNFIYQMTAFILVLSVISNKFIMFLNAEEYIVLVVLTVWFVIVSFRNFSFFKRL